GGDGTGPGQAGAAGDEEDDGEQDGDGAAPPRGGDSLATHPFSSEVLVRDGPSEDTMTLGFCSGRSCGSSSGSSRNGRTPMSAPARRGRVSRNEAPSPGRDHASRLPPCKRASSSEIASPRPVPPVVRARAGSARQNRSKTWDAASASMPTPWSRTRTATAELLAATVISIGWPSPCSMALESRLRRTRSILRES